MELSDVDRRLLALLQEDARRSNAEIAERAGLSPSACHRRVQRLFADGVIERVGAVVNRRKAGLCTLGFVSVKLESHDPAMIDAFTRGIEAIAEVVECYAISGRGDYLLKVVAADMDDFAEVALKRLVRLPGVKDSTTDFVLETVKKSAALPI